MTREEEIIEASINYTIKNRPNVLAGGKFSEEMRDFNRNKAFEEGAKWADENPNLYNNEKYHTVKVSCLDELNKKAVLYDEFLEKACEWLQAKNRMCMFEIEMILGKDYIEDFKKVMEE